VIARHARPLAVAVAAAGLALAAGAPSAAAVPRGCGSTDVPGGDWRGYGGDFQNSRTQFREKSISEADVPLLSPAWTFSTVRAGGRGDIPGTPVVVDGCMYVGTSRGWVFEVNADTGRTIWKAKLPFGGEINASLFVAKRTLPAAKKRRGQKGRPRSRTAGTVYAAVTRTQKFEGNCRKGDPCQGPYVAAFDQATGRLAWATRPPALRAGPTP